MEGDFAKKARSRIKMIDPIIAKHNHEEQEKINKDPLLSDSEKTQLIDMLDSTLENTNGHITDEKVKRLAVNGDKLGVLFARMYRKTNEGDKKRDKRLDSLEASVERLSGEVSQLRVESKEGDRDLGKSIDALRDESREDSKSLNKKLDDNQEKVMKALNELQKKELIREGKESAETSEDLSIKRQSIFMAWVERNQFWLFLIILLIGIQGGNIGKWIMGLMQLGN